jgi:hypothetical protein
VSDAEEAGTMERVASAPPKTPISVGEYSFMGID